MVLHVLHTDQVMPSKKILKEKVSEKFKCDARNIVLYGFNTVFGGGESTGFCMIYEN